MTNQAPPADRRLSPRDWSLRVKLIVLLLVPGVLAVVLGGFRIADQAGQAAQLDRVSRFAAAQGRVETLVERVQLERLRSTAYVADGRRGDRASLGTVFADVDAAGAAVTPQVAALYSEDSSLVGVDRQSQQALARLAALRDLVLTSNAPASAVISRYSDLLAQLSQLDEALLRGVDSTEVAGLTGALGGLEAARNEASLQLTILTAASRSPDPASVALAGLDASDARLTTALASFRTSLDAGQRVRYAGLIAGPSNTARAGLVQGLLARDPAQPTPTGTAAAAAPVYNAFVAEVDAAQSSVRSELTATTSARRTTAIELVWLNVGLLLLALLVGATIVGLMTRAMLTSLRTLRLSALDVAQRRLPEAVRRMRTGAVPDVDVEPVPVTTREEIGEVARAFDAVHTQAVRLAAEQATLQNSVNNMFINLSRRSQSLVDKQLQLIEALESNEQDSDQLSNLFRLDHLATRMRRNSENLLVLAGTELTKRSARHVPLVDVLRAAVGEIERYERIVVEQQPAVLVFGQAANDLQHLFAELLDNATSFSPPDSQVVMATDRSPDGAVIVDVADLGVGMRPAELATANAQLGRQDGAMVDASRQMGLFVVGRLAARHGVHVRLTSNSFASPGSRADQMGLTARVTIPAELLVESPTLGPGAVPRPRTEQQVLAGPPSRPEQPALPPAAGDLFAPLDRDATRVPEHDAPRDRPTAAPAPRPPVPSQAIPVQPIPVQPTPAQPTPVPAQPTPAPPAPRRPEPVPAAAAPVAERPEEPSASRHGMRAPARATLFRDTGSGWTRSYRPVQINWAPDPDTGLVPDEARDAAQASDR